MRDLYHNEGMSSLKTVILVFEFMFMHVVYRLYISYSDFIFAVYNNKLCTKSICMTNICNCWFSFEFSSDI
jgi:hypothetical protein